MVKVGQSDQAALEAVDLKGRIVSFMRGASTEITPSEESRLPELARVLPAGTAVYVAHTPSVRALTRTLGAPAHHGDWATSPDQHLLALLGAPVSAQIVAPHFFAFGGALETARWIQKIAAGAFEIDTRAAQLRTLD
jgi:hypothetical protein